MGAPIFRRRIYGPAAVAVCRGAKRLPLYQVGILQYIAPTITLMLGVFVYHEPFSGQKAFTFICIWATLLLFTFSQIKWKRPIKSR